MANHQIKNCCTGAVLFECDVSGVEGGMAERYALEKATKAGAYLRGAYLRDAYLGGANLRGADLRGAYLRGADLRGAYLRDAYLGGADLRGADLGGAYLRAADLRGADLRGADLRGADLRGAYLRGADLRGADLGGADLGGGAKWAEGVLIKLQPLQLSGLRWPVTILDAHMQIGCQLHTLAAWDAFDDAAIAAMDGRDALRFWRAHKDALLGLARGAGRNFEPVGSVECGA